LRNRNWVIVNPAAGRGSGREKLATLRTRLAALRESEFRETGFAGQEETFAAEALASGAQTIVAVGGDGTCSRIANAILRSATPCTLAVVPSGTGNDFAKTLGLAEWNAEQIADLVVRGTSTRMDVGVADGHYFVNSCGFGFDASVLEATRRVRFLKGDAVYIYSALTQLFSYPGMEVSANGTTGLKQGRKLMVTVSNGRFLGGAFKIAPHASVVDGKLDACFIGDSNVLERLRLFIGAMSGKHLGMRSVTAAAVDRLALTFERSPSMEIDGELRIARSRMVELKCIPRALSVIAAPGALR
jgi:diacylglycerol kinase (ATP)